MNRPKKSTRHMLNHPASHFGLIGERLDYSFSSSYFTKKFEELKLRDHSYQNLEMSDIEAIQRFKSEITYHKIDQTTRGKHLIWRGLNVTIPYKEKIIPLLEDIDPIAKAIGAVNTIAIEDNAWKGYNTDVIGFGESLKAHLSKCKKALILGSGGASKAIAFFLSSAQIPYLFVSRKPKGPHQVGYDQVNRQLLQQVELIINTTPLGTFPNVDQCPDLPYPLLNKHHICYDLIYNPAMTLFLKKAAHQGATTMNGHPMLIGQAEASWKLWQR